MTLGDNDKGQTRSEWWLSKLYPLVQSSGGATFYGAITTATSTTQFKVDSLQGLGTDLLEDAYYCQIIQADAAAPEGEIQKVSVYDTSDGNITVGTAFTVAPDVGDYILILHESVVVAIADTTNNLFMSDVIGNKTDTSAVPSTTTSLVAIVKKIYDNVTIGVGNLQIKATTIDLNQGIGTYDLFTGTTQDVVVESLVIRTPNIVAGGALTSISIQTNDTTAQVFISTALGAVANLTAEAQLSSNAPIMISTGQKIQLTIAGGAHGVAYVCDVAANYRTVVAGGYLT